MAFVDSQAPHLALFCLKKLGGGCDHHAQDCHIVGDNDPSDGRVVPARRVCDRHERPGADKSRKNGNALQLGLERCINEEQSEQPEQDGPVSHQDFQVWFAELQSIQALQARRSKNTR